MYLVLKVPQEFARTLCPYWITSSNPYRWNKKLQDRHLEDKIQGLYSLSGKTSYQQILHVSKPRYGMLQCSYRTNICQESRQRCCRGACQISEWLEKLKPESRGTSWDLAVRPLFAKWIDALSFSQQCSCWWLDTYICNHRYRQVRVPFIYGTSIWSFVMPFTTFLAFCFDYLNGIIKKVHNLFWYKLHVITLKGALLQGE